MGTVIGPWDNHNNENIDLKEENEKLKQRVVELEKKIRDMEIEKDNEDNNYYECRGC